MDDLLIIDLRNPKMNAAQTMADAADEIERLRALITAWAIADDAVSQDDYFNTLRIREQARDALRKTVGR